MQTDTDPRLPPVSLTPAETLQALRDIRRACGDYRVGCEMIARSHAHPGIVRDALALAQIATGMGQHATLMGVIPLGEVAVVLMPVTASREMRERAMRDCTAAILPELSGAVDRVLAGEVVRVGGGWRERIGGAWRVLRG